MRHGVAEGRQGKNRIGHGRVNRPQPPFTLHVIQQPGLGFLDRFFPYGKKRIFFVDLQNPVDPNKKVPPTDELGIFLKRRGVAIVDLIPWRAKQFFNSLFRGEPAFAANGKHNKQRGHDGSGPIRDGVQVKSKLFGYQHDFGRHAWKPDPIVLPEQGQGNFRKHVGRHHAAFVQDGLSGSTHPRIILGNPGQFQGKVGLDRGTDVHGGSSVYRPPAIFELSALKIANHSGFPLLINDTHIPAQHQIFRGQRRIRLQFLHPIAVFRMLLFEQPSRAPRQRFFYDFRMSDRGWGGPALNELRPRRHVGVVRDKLQGRVVRFPMTGLGFMGGRGEKTLRQPPQEIYEKIHI